MDKQTQLLRWRLILGKEIQKELNEIQPFTLSSGDQRLDTALASIYGTQDEALGESYPTFDDQSETQKRSASEAIESESANATDGKESSNRQNNFNAAASAEEILEFITNPIASTEIVTDTHQSNSSETNTAESNQQNDLKDVYKLGDDSSKSGAGSKNDTHEIASFRRRIIQKYAIQKGQNNIAENAQSSDNTSNSMHGGKEPPYPVIAKWIGDLYHFFDKDTVTIIQTDAVERKGLKKLLFEPNLIEKLEPNIKMVSTLLSLKEQIPPESRNAVKSYIRKIVEKINQMLSIKLSQSVKTAINKREHSVIQSANAIDFPYTIKKNLKNYSKDLNTIIPEHIYFFDHALKRRKFHIILDIDQSGSMYESVIYASVISCILASVKSIKTDVVLFSTDIVDITGQTDDPVELLYGIQIGGGTDITKSLSYCQNLVTTPESTIIFLISDLYDGVDESEVIKKAKEIKESGATLISILSISDEGMPDYNERIAHELSQYQIPCFACMPEKFPELLKKAMQHLPLDLS